MANGRLTDAVLSPIPGGRLEDNAAIAWNDMRAFIGKKHGVWIAPTGPNSSYRSYAGQLYFWRLYQSGRGNVAAYPGRSNHGWGKAVDVATPTMAYYIRKYGHLFGWSWAEGRRVGEWWHFTYVGGYRRKTDPLAVMTDRERRLILEYRKLRAANQNRKRRGEIFRWLIAQRKRIYREAQKTGWNKAHRRQRYAIIKTITG